MDNIPPLHAKIIDLYKSDKSISFIARELHKDKRFIKKVLENNRIELPGLKKVLKPCLHCGKTYNLKTTKTGQILPTCDNQECYNHYKKLISKKRRKTVNAKYGVENIAQLNSSKEKAKKTNISKYGVANPQQNKKIRDKTNSTMQKRYGVAHPSQNKEIAKKMAKTNLQRYGVKNVIQNKDIKKKAQDTCLAKYGVANIFESEQFKEAQRIAMLDLYDVEYYAQTAEMKEKSRKTMLKNYGVEYHSQVPEIKEKMWETYRKNYWEKFLSVLASKKIKPLFRKDDYISLNTDLTYECLRCGNKLHFDFLNPHRMHCSCMLHRSSYEDEIIDWLRTFAIKAEPNKKFYEGGKLKFEIDVFLPEQNRGIDFHGLYWHSDKFKDRNYHQKKFLYFKELGIQLIQIFENEWVEKEDIVKSILSSNLGINNTIFARKCIVQELKYKECSSFLEENHLQGSVPASHYIGLFFDNELVQISSFSKSRFDKKINSNTFELIRFASKKNVTVVGGFSKLLSYFIKTFLPEKIISFVDARYFTGAGYKESGFINDSITKPNYFYFKKNSLSLHSRIKFQKHKLKDKLEIFDPKLSEYENMTNNNYLRIFDAGNLKMIKSFS